MSTPLAIRGTEFLHALDRTERYVLALFYADDLTVSEIGMVLDLPDHRVETIIVKLQDHARRLLGVRPRAA